MCPDSPDLSLSLSLSRPDQCTSLGLQIEHVDRTRIGNINDPADRPAVPPWNVYFVFARPMFMLDKISHVVIIAYSQAEVVGHRMGN